MPELPEMQALAERLDAAFSGAPLTKALPLQFSAAKTFEPPLESYVGRRLGSVGRRGKYLLFDFGGPRLLLHLSQGGRVDLEQPPKKTRPKGSVLRLVFGDHGAMLVKEFGTERKAGWWTLAPGEEGPLAGLGPEPFDSAFRELVLTANDGRRIHTWLRDQRTVAGIGRGYSDEILHAARLSPYSSVARLKDEQRRALLDSVTAVLIDALESERKRTGGLPAKLKDRFRVHGNAGAPCPRCGQTLQRVWHESYEIAYCPQCQTDGRILADRRLSRLLK